MKTYRVEIFRNREVPTGNTREFATEIMFERMGLTRRDWDNIVLSLRGSLRACDTEVIAFLYVDNSYCSLASLWRDFFDPSILHLDMVQDGKYLEIRTIKEVA